MVHMMGVLVLPFHETPVKQANAGNYIGASQLPKSEVWLIDR